MKNNLYPTIISALKWYKIIGKRFIDIVPLDTLAIVFFTMLSQLSMLLASLLPLKVIILLGTNRTPHYFPESFQSLDRELLIFLLAMSAVVFYIVHLVSEKRVELYSDKGSNKILENNRKIVIFENQNIIASKAYGRYAKGISKFIFTFLALVLIALLYPFLFFILLEYFIFIGMFLLIRSKNKLFFIYLNENTVNIFQLVGGMGFLIAFASILASYLLKIFPPNLIVAIISILLVRQLIRQFVAAVIDFTILYKDHVKINSLFFYKNFHFKDSSSKDEDFWYLFKKEKRNVWISEVVERLSGKKYHILQSKWYQLDLKNIAMFHVNALEVNSTLSKNFLIKIYNKKITSKALHEATLLQYFSKDFLAPNLLGVTTIESFHCHIFTIDCITKIDMKNLNENILHIKKELMMIEPPQELLQRYTRSHPLIWQRLNTQTIYQLMQVADDTQLKNIISFENSFEDLMIILSRLPLKIINNNRRMNSILITGEDKKLQILHWANWSIEPIGFDWSLNQNSKKYLNEHLSTNSNVLKNISIEHIYLSSMLAQFETLSLNQNFSEIIKLIPNILNTLSLLKKPREG